MDSSFSSSSSSSSSKSPPMPSHRRPRFTPIQECEREELDEHSTPSVKKLTPTQKHIPTPLHHRSSNKSCSKNSHHDSASSEEGSSVSCNYCRPNVREKFSVVPLDNNGVSKNNVFSMASPSGVLKSIFQSLTRSPNPNLKPIDSSSSREEQWKVAVSEISDKLIQATRKRDEAVLEASKLKHSMADLEKKLNMLEVSCHNLKSGIDECNGNGNGNGNGNVVSPYRVGKNQDGGSRVLSSNSSSFDVGLRYQNDKVIEKFLVSISEARSSIRLLSRSLTMQLRHIGGKVYERISLLLQPYEIKISHSKNPKILVFYLEALLNKAFFEDFESITFQKHPINHILNPIEKCEANHGSFNDLQGLKWDDVLSKGTRHFNEEFSRFCDWKMSEIVAMLGWNRAWPEPLLQAFFNASKSVWLVHLLANSVHPGLPIFRVDKGVKFDHVYMEDMGGDRAKKLVPTMVRIMVTPGFYVYNNVVKCKVLCNYHNNIEGSRIEGKGLTP